MKRILSLLTVILLVFSLSACGTVNDIETGRVYKCDYKSLNINTKITTKFNDEDIIISGNVFKFLTDPLTVKDKDGNVLGYAGDAYGVFKQDDHGIYVGEEFDINMCGKFNLFGNSYDLKDSKGNIVAFAKFNMTNTSGKIIDSNENLIASYSSLPFANDYVVTIYDNDVCSDLSILMIMASYVSDYKADSSN